MTTSERVRELTSRRWLSGVDQTIADFRTDPERAKRPTHRPIDWRGQDWVGIDAAGGHFVDAILWETDLSHGRMEGADFTGADLAGGSLRKSKLRGAKFRDAVLAGADLREADLREADFTGADLAQAKLQGADLTGAVLDEADVSGAVFADEEGDAVGLTEAQVQRARWEAAEPPALAGGAFALNTWAQNENSTDSSEVSHA